MASPRVFYLMKKNSLKVVLERLKVPYTNSYVDALYEKYPHDSMFAISRLLNLYKISNEGLMLDDKAEVLNIEPPYIAQFASDLVVVERYIGEDVHIFKSGHEVTVSSKHFKEGCSGAVLLFDTDESSGEPRYRDNLYKEAFSKFSSFVLQIGLLLLFFIASLQLGVFNSIGRICYLLLSLWGISLSYLIITKEIGSENIMVNRFCSILGDKGDCGSVIKSEGAKLFGIIGWAEIGLGYFISSAVLIVFKYDFVLLIVLINGVSLLFIPWSVWYQRVKVGKWCPLCLMVLLTMILLFINGLFFTQTAFPKLSIIHISEIAFIYLCPLLATSLIVSLLSEKKQLSNLVTSYSKIKFNDVIFKTRLESQPHYDVDLSVSRILFGNTEAKNLVSIISNPHCGPCARIHNELDRLIEYKSKELCIQFIFLNFKDEAKMTSGRFLISAYLQEGKDKARTIFERWFSSERKNVSQTYAKYGFNIESKEVHSEQHQHDKWCAAQGIIGTPTILINGYLLPPEYSPDDLLFLF